ncbi:MAG: tryptophan synthase subunit alpha [Actinomycetota bacterium]|jgi:tryptophan synthase alpha chain|nr:tryptophan synthase subunit alpha [Actinomycetota bacterium]
MGGLGEGFTRGHTALVTYLMAGYPDRETSLAAMRAAARGGADIIELGVPYGDPLADGPVIARAGRAAMKAAPEGFGLPEALEMATAFTLEPGVSAAEAPPVALMTYLNPVMRLGYAETAKRARAAGVAGFIIPDLPADEAGEWLSVSDGLDTVFLVAPTSTADRLATAGAASSGFVYCVSRTGITGERSQLPEHLADLVVRTKEHTKLPVAVGFGIATPDQAVTVGKVADGVVVGSAIVRRQEEPVAVEKFVRSLRDALDTDSE